ncbi:MAG TPA: hypothetical protein PKL60_04830, partial [Anaerolineaceae bacterium]|nr:hypothetical protein [Anaerolineaceae bacterium]
SGQQNDKNTQPERSRRLWTIKEGFFAEARPLQGSRMTRTHSLSAAEGSGLLKGDSSLRHWHFRASE